MTFHDSYEYSDAVIAEMFEGIPQDVEWTAEEIELIRIS